MVELAQAINCRGPKCDDWKLLFVWKAEELLNEQEITPTVQFLIISCFILLCVAAVGVCTGMPRNGTQDLG
jgi:hypothetical protein